MRLISTILLTICFFSIRGQGVIGGAGVCHVNADPNTISGMDVRNPESDCMKAHNYLTGEEWTFDDSQDVGAKWVLDASTTLTEGQVDNYVSNNGYLTTEIDGSISNEIELPSGGSNGQVLSTNGNGIYSWITPPSIYNSNGSLSTIRTISQGNRHLNFNLNGSGNFYIRENGTNFITATNSGNLGIGLGNPVDKLSIVNNHDAMTNLKESIYINEDVAGSLTGNRTHRGIFYDYDGTDIDEGTRSLSIRAIESSINITGTSSTGASSVYGNYTNISNNASSGTIDNAYGNYIWINQDDAGSATDRTYANYARIDRDAGDSNTGYLYFGVYQGTHTNKWGIYLSGETTNFMSGNLGLGTATPTGKLDVNGNIRMRGDIIDSNNSTGTNDKVLGRDNGGVIWKSVSTVPAGGSSGQILSTDGNNNLSWVDDQTGGGGTSDGVVNSVTGISGDPTRELNRTIGSSVPINIEDGDSDPTNEIETWSTLSGIPTDIIDGDDVDDADSDPTNEIETWSTLSGIPSDIVDGDDDTQLTESQVDNFVSNNGYLTAEVDGSITNEIELPTGGNNGQILSTDGIGNYSWVDDQSGSGDGVVQFIANNNAGTSTRALQRSNGLSTLSLNVEDGDADDTNELELPSGGLNGQVLSTNGSGTYTWVDDQVGGGGASDGVVNSTSGTVGSSTRNLNRTIGSPVTINVEDGDSDDTNEIETWSTLAGIPSDIADGDDNTQLSESQVDNFVANNGYLSSEVDGSITNEIELPAGGSNGDILETDGNGNYAWTAPPSGGGTDGNGIYDGDGALSTNTDIDMAGNQFYFNGLNGSTGFIGGGVWLNMYHVNGEALDVYPTTGNGYNLIASDNLNLGGGTTTDLTITSSGDVGIGQTSPAEKLEVDGAINIGNTTNANSGTIRYDGNQFQGHDGVEWHNLRSVPSYGKLVFTSNKNLMTDTNEHLFDWDIPQPSSGNVTSDATGDFIEISENGLYLINFDLRLTGDVGARLIVIIKASGSVVHSFRIDANITGQDSYNFSQVYRKAGSSPRNIELYYQQSGSTATSFTDVDGPTEITVTKISDL